MSTEEKPLPDFSLPSLDDESPTVKTNGLPRVPRPSSSGRRAARVETAAPVEKSYSAFSNIEADEVTKTLDHGMSEEDLQDISEGEGTTSDLHSSLLALHSTPGNFEDDFTFLSNDYESGIREEDTYMKEDEPDFELPPLEEPDEKPVIKPVATPAVKSGLPTNRSKFQSLPDFSKFDEVEKAEEETPKPVVEEKKVKTKEKKVIKEHASTKISKKTLLIIAATIFIAIIAFLIVVFLVPWPTSATIVAPDTILNSIKDIRMLV